MTFRELLKELETMSIQALNKEVRIELDGDIPPYTTQSQTH